MIDLDTLYADYETARKRAAEEHPKYSQAQIDALVSAKLQAEACREILEALKEATR